MGLGDLSLPFRYTATDDCSSLSGEMEMEKEPIIECIIIADVVSSEGPESDVIFSESSPAPTVELTLTLALV